MNPSGTNFWASALKWDNIQNESIQKWKKFPTYNEPVYFGFSNTLNKSYILFRVEGNGFDGVESSLLKMSYIIGSDITTLDQQKYDKL